MSDTQYKALSPKISSLMTHDDIDKLAKLSWIAMGIYQYLLLDGAKSVADLGHQSPKTPYAAISDALDELITVGLVAEVVGEVMA
jgi:hypothetical protein